MKQMQLATEQITLTVNGRPREMPPETTVASLLQSLSLDPQMVVVEHNREILRDRSALSRRVLQDGDVLEIVHFVGGG